MPMAMSQWQCQLAIKWKCSIYSLFNRTWITGYSSSLQLPESLACQIVVREFRFEHFLFLSSYRHSYTVCPLRRLLYTCAQAHCGSYGYVCVMQHHRLRSHNSPIANATILKSGLVHYKLHLYNPSGVFYFPWHRHQVEGTYDF